MIMKFATILFDGCALLGNVAMVATWIAADVLIDSAVRDLRTILATIHEPRPQKVWVL